MLESGKWIKEMAKNPEPNMSMYRFPPVEMANEDGLLAYGGDLSPQRLLAAYRQGIFPWYNEGQPILWWSPDPRAVLFPDSFHVSKSLRKTIRSGKFEVTLDTRFEEVINACARVRTTPTGPGTWITAEMIDAYLELHRLGYAHSVEVLNGRTLVGGLYGIAIGKAFFGESMFSIETDASKAGFARLCQQLSNWDFDFVDCQVSSEHLMRLGAQQIPRKEFIQRLKQATSHPDRPGTWSFKLDESES